MKKDFTLPQRITLLFFYVFAVLITGSFFDLYGQQGQDDPVLAPNISVLPVVDGIGDDQCWDGIPWQNIDNTWIPYGDSSVSAADYSGRYKIAWSSATNLLYFLIEVNDDSFVDGFAVGSTPDTYNFDISEVFIDENNSGGMHIFDNNTSNAENAFTYHMYAAIPDDGEVLNFLYADDLAGNNWGNVRRPNNASHFPEFAIRVSGNTALREFSLIVYNDTYSENNKEASRVTLTPEKEMGLSVAYCDNDNQNENPIERDNMFGSVWEPDPGNLHWQNADYFGTVKLVTEITGVAGEQAIAAVSAIKLYPNPASSTSNLLLENPYTGEISIRLFNILGEEVFYLSDYKSARSYSRTLTFNHITSGIYFLSAQLGSTNISKKIIINSK